MSNFFFTVHCLFLASSDLWVCSPSYVLQCTLTTSGLRFTPCISFRLSFSHAESKLSNNKQTTGNWWVYINVLVRSIFCSFKLCPPGSRPTLQINILTNQCGTWNLYRFNRHLPSPSSSSSPPSSSSSSTSLSCSPSSSYKNLIDKDHSRSAVMNEREENVELENVLQSCHWQWHPLSPLSVSSPSASKCKQWDKTASLMNVVLGNSTSTKFTLPDDQALFCSQWIEDVINICIISVSHTFTHSNIFVSSVFFLTEFSVCSM